MRFYDISVFQPEAATPFRQWMSHPNGRFDPAALDVEFDAPITTMGNPSGGATVTIHGVDIADLMQPQQFGPRYLNGQLQSGMTLVMKGGMGAGLPLANPAQQGVILKGTIFQAFGNWEGTNMSLDLVVYAGEHSSDNPGNFVLNWQKGQPLSQAIQQCFSVAYPNVPLSINISPNLIQSHDEQHFASTIEEISQHVLETTEGQFLGASYPGVQVALQNGVLSVYDSTWTPPTVQLNFTDLIGQPTWIDPLTMQVKLVMRGDIQVGTNIRMPQGMANAPGLVANNGNFPSMTNTVTTFTGKFQVTAVRHVGSFRATDGGSWATIINCVMPDPSGSSNA